MTRMNIMEEKEEKERPYNRQSIRETHRGKKTQRKWSFVTVDRGGQKISQQGHLKIFFLGKKNVKSIPLQEYTSSEDSHSHPERRVEDLLMVVYASHHRLD